MKIPRKELVGMAGLGNLTPKEWRVVLHHAISMANMVGEETAEVDGG